MKEKYIYLIAGFIFLFDFIIKESLIQTLTEPITIIDSFFSIILVKNTGGAFSVLSGNTLFLAIIGIIFLVFIVKYIKTKKDTPKWERICLSFILGGLVGNLWDRIIRDGVIDYLSFQFWNYSFPVFNLADIFITLGVIGIILYELRGEIHESRNRKCKN